jgi:serine phosphatase RsbU (regulator of sigma subunit)
MLSIQIAVAKTHKYASRDSGDTAETVERPTGGVSMVLVDGQGSGQAAKSLSMMVSSKAVSLLKEGVRDGAIARATHDFLHAYRHGRVSATLDIVSVDLAAKTILVTRNSATPYLVRRNGDVERQESASGPIGLYRHTRPAIDQYAIEAGLTVVIFSDGIVNAGHRLGTPFDAHAFVRDQLPHDAPAHELADGVLEAAIAADQGRPNDDMTVAAVTIATTADEQPIRTIRVSVPFTT